MRRLARISSAMVVTAFMVVCLVYWYTTHETLPREIRIAAGKQDGLYHTLAQHIAKCLHERTGRQVRVIETAGTAANVELIRSGGAELALIQNVSSTPQGLVGIAPMYPEMLHFLARKGKGIRSPKDLERRRVALGLPGSSMRQTSLTVLSHFEVKDVNDLKEYFGTLASDPDVDAALVTTGWMNPTMEKLLLRGDVELMGIDDPEGLALRYPWFTATTIPQGLYPGNPPVPRAPIPTVSVTALLAGRTEASDRLVREALMAVYESDLRATFPAVLSAKAAKDFDGAVMHPAVASYHNPAASLNRLSQALELIGKSKEAVLGVVAFLLLIWGWLRKRRERSAAAADRAQKQKLDEFIARTLTVELEQMDVTDPEQLRPFLRQVTRIKQEALRELTSEKVRGDQLFAIFLSQCAALSEKIQMRMMYGRMTEEVGQAWKAAPERS